MNPALSMHSVSGGRKGGMKIIKGLKNIRGIKGGSIVAIGVFDGVHIGHQHIITQIVKRAKKIGAKSVVLTFDPHPLKVLAAGSFVPSLISLKHKARLIEALGADYLVIIGFTKRFSRVPPKAFVKKILLDKLSVKEIYVSKDFYFGRGAKGGIELLKILGNLFGFEAKVIKPIRKGPRVVSSSAIRRLISSGDIAKASEFLGRPVTVLGTVVRGLRRGRILGFPTANVNPHHEVIPPSGVYAVRVDYKNRRLKGVLNIGRRPTFFSGGKDIEPTIEVHIFDFGRKIYGEDIEIIFVKKIRDEKRFMSSQALAAEIKRDAQTARTLLR